MAMVETQEQPRIDPECLRIRRANFPDRMRFHAPGLKPYSTSEYRCQDAAEFVSVSVTGDACALRCEHCKMKVLHGMGDLPKFDGSIFDLCAELKSKGAKGVLVSGGSSVGQEDHAPRLLSELGSLDFHGVSMRPASPAGIGRIGERFVFLLPGNPVSCLSAYEFFAGPSLRVMGGLPKRWPHRRVCLPLARKIASSVGRTDYVRVAIENGLVFPLATSGASILSSTVRASGAVIVSREHEGMAEGAEVEVLLYDDDFDPALPDSDGISSGETR